MTHSISVNTVDSTNNLETGAVTLNIINGKNKQTKSDSDSEKTTSSTPKLRNCFLGRCLKSVWKKVNTQKMSESGDDVENFESYTELEEVEQSPRCKPDSLTALCQATRFTEAEIKRIYRGFKSECPSGVVKEDTFKLIYASFFPQGANTGLYAHYVFNTLDKDKTGILSFENFVQGLSILSRGTLEEKLCWTFKLYDINNDGQITREEMTDIVHAVFELMGARQDPTIDEEKIKERVEKLFQKMDRNHDGVITIDEFIDCCRKDQTISHSMGVFDTTI